MDQIIEASESESPDIRIWKHIHENHQLKNISPHISLNIVS